MEKAIDIKRRAQRSIQNGDLDGALKEYEKLIALQDSDPYNFVLLADLLFKKGDTVGAAQRYITAIECYERATLYKNAIAVGKKMMRLSLSPTLVLQKLAGLHALDGLGTEAALFYQQYAEHLLRDNRTTEAADALRRAFEASPENVKALERLADVFILDGDNDSALRTLGEAAVHYQSSGLLQDADRCRVRASTVNGGKPVPSSPQAPVLGGAAPRPESVPAAEVLTAGFDADVPVASDAEVFEVERSHMTSLSDSGSGADAGFEVERTPVAKSADRDDSAFAGEITHSMEIASAAEVGEPSGPPALEAAGLPIHDIAQAPQPKSVGPPALGSVTPHLDSGQPAAAELRLESRQDKEQAAPGLRFNGPAAAAAENLAQEAVAADAAEAQAEAASVETDTARVERLLREAREQFRAGERETAAGTLVRAARLYDEMGQFDSAATIYRNLGRSMHAAAEVMTLWLGNCEARNDQLEAAQVACELGDRSLNDGDMTAARDWFQRASALDAANDTAKRRLQKLGELRVPGVVTAAAPAAPAAADGRVQIAVGRSEAVTFDLGSLVSEFQRGVESQISGDPQGHYDLGMAYREMGLLEQAIESFRTAGRDANFAQRCAEMVGRTMLDQGRFEEAAQEFIVALELPGLSADGAHDLRYQLGLCYEAAGRTEEALSEFEGVYAVMPSYPDVALKIRVLRQATESG